MKVTEKLKFVLGRVENILGKGENAGHQHFLHIPKRFKKASSSRIVKSRECVVKSYGNTIKKKPFCNFMILISWWFVLFFHINSSDTNIL